MIWSSCLQNSRAKNLQLFCKFFYDNFMVMTARQKKIIVCLPCKWGIVIMMITFNVERSGVNEE